MTKSRSFTIFLLKKDYNAENALQDEHGLEEDVKAEALPNGASLFVRDTTPQNPWWKDYFGIKKPLKQVAKGALVFLPVGKRCFVLSFGFVSHYLKDASYEHDFGLKVTLNSVDPKKLRSTDVLDPGAARRRRTQMPVEADLTFFEFDRDSTMLKRLTGKVKDENKELFKHATGSSNLRISSPVSADELVKLCEKLLALYESEDYKTTFPDIQHIAPVSDPSIIEALNGKLLEAFRAKDDALNLTVPELINYSDNVLAKFAGAGAGLLYDEVAIARYYEYLKSHGVKRAEIDIDGLKRHRLVLTNEDGDPRESYSVYKSLIFDTSLGKGGDAYHLCEGSWYRVEPKYVARIEQQLDPLCVDLPLPAYEHDGEGAYNEKVAEGDKAFVCLDQTSISPAGQSAVEPCDLYSVVDGVAIFHHVKVSTLSNKLSHLFNQGTNSIELIRSEEDALSELEKRIKEASEVAEQEKLLAPLKEHRHQVVFAIITHKDKAQKSKNLPLFSRISLARSMKHLKVMNVAGRFGFVKDESPKTEGKEKPRKAKKKGAGKE